MLFLSNKNCPNLKRTFALFLSHSTAHHLVGTLSIFHAIYDAYSIFNCCERLKHFSYYQPPIASAYQVNFDDRIFNLNANNSPRWPTNLVSDSYCIGPIALIKNATKATYLELSLFAIISLVSLLVPQGNLDATKLAVVKTDSAEELIQILNEAGFDADGPDTTALPIDGANVEKLTLVSSPAILEVKKDHECKLCSADGPIEIPAHAYSREILENFAIFFGITLDTRFEKHKAEENAIIENLSFVLSIFFQTQ